MTESNVLYTQAANPNAGAVPQLTNIATHERASDGADVQDVYLDNLRDFFTEVSEGNITGYSLIHKFGASASIGTTLLPVALANTYQTPTTATSLEFVSNSANDTASGTGARQITVIGIGADWTEVSQTVTTNGTTAVALATPLLRLYRWYVSQSGTYATQSASSHVGTLTIRVAGGGTTWSQIPVTPFPMGQSQIGVYTIPLGKTAFLLSLDAYVSSSKAVDVLVFQRPNANDITAPYTGAIRLVSQWAQVTGHLPVKYRSPRGPFVGPCDIGFMAKTSVGTGSATVEFELILENS